MGAVLMELEATLRAKGGMSRFEEGIIGACKKLSAQTFTVSATVLGLPVWFVSKRLGAKPGVRFVLSVGSALSGGMVGLHTSLNNCVKNLLDFEGQRMQMEVAKIILNRHSDDQSMMALVRRRFFPEQVFNDLQQESPLFRWRPRYSYVDSAFLENTEDVGDVSSDDNGKSISRQTTSPFGDLMEDPLECILGSTGGNVESSKHLDNMRVISKKRKLRAHRRVYRHHRHRTRHAEKVDAASKA